MRTLSLAGVLALAAAGHPQNPAPDVETIMSRVGRNQAKSQDARANWLYTQKQLLRALRPGGQVAREERREYLVEPAGRSVKKELTHFEGHYQHHGRMVAFDQPGFRYRGLDLDGNLIDDMSNDMLGDAQSRDGIGRDLFPFTYHQQLKYSFRLLGSEPHRGRTAYRVAFVPKHGEDADWKGEALIDAAEFQPVSITTTLAVKIPLLVKTLLGTNIKGLGFSLSYEKFAEGVWFPVSYGGEFEVRGVFLYRRTFTISMTNRDFRKADVTSDIRYAEDQP